MENITADPDGHENAVRFVGEHIDLPVRALFASIGSFMIITAVPGNFTLFVIVVKNFNRNRMKNLHNLFVVNLILDDILLMGYWFTFFVLDLVLGYHPVVDGSHCTANGVILGVLYMVNLDSLVSISFNRYLHVCHYHLYRRVFTLPRTVGWCVTMWVVSLLLLLPPLWGGAAGSYYYNPETHACSYNREGFTYLKALVVLYTVVPPFLIGYFNFAIFRCWRQARMSLTSRYPVVRKEQKNKRNVFARWRNTKKAAPTPFAADTAPEQDVTNQTESIARSQQIILQTRPTDLSKGTDETRMPSAVCDVKQKMYIKDGDDAGGSEEMTQNTHDLQVKVYVTDNVSISSGSVDSHHENADNTEDGVFSDKTEKRHQEDSIGPEIGDSRPSSELRTKILSQQVETKCTLHSQIETDTETDETKTNTGSCDPSSVTVSSTTASPPPSTESQSRCKPHHPSPLKRGKPQNQNTATELHHQERLRKKRQGKEEAFVRTILIVCILAFVTFLPYIILIQVDSIVKLPKEVLITGNLIIFLNNTVNWLVYGAMNPAFRRGYVKCFQQILSACRQ